MECIVANPNNSLYWQRNNYKYLTPPPAEENILAYQFPLELYVHLFSFLGSKSILGVVKVCKEWNSLEIEVFRLFADQVGLEYPGENVEKFYAILKKHLIFDKTSKKMLVNFLSIAKRGKSGSQKRRRRKETKAKQSKFKEIINQMPVPAVINTRAGLFFQDQEQKVKFTNDPEEISNLIEDKRYVWFNEIETFENAILRYPKTLFTLKILEKETEKLQDLKRLKRTIFISPSLYRVMNIQQHLALLLWACRNEVVGLPEIFKYLSRQDIAQLDSYDISIEKILYYLGNRVAKNSDLRAPEAEKIQKMILKKFWQTPVSEGLTPDETSALTLFDSLFLKIPIKLSFYRMLQTVSKRVSRYPSLSSLYYPYFIAPYILYNFRGQERLLLS